MSKSDGVESGAAAATERVVETLRERMLQGQLLPGAPLREVLLAAELDVSRNTLREALRLLAAQDLVDVQFHRGAIVKVLSEEQIRDIYVVRRTLELRAVDDGTLTRGVSPGALEDAARLAERAVSERAWREVGTASLQFHQALVATLGSPRLSGFFTTIVAQLRLAFAVAADEADFQRPWVSRDREICDLLRAGSRAAAAAALSRYLDDSERAVCELVRGRGH